jgi:hypothetical protein
MPNLVVRPISRSLARTVCEAHPHAQTLPNSSRYYMAAYLDGKIAGLAVWGWGIMPRHTPRHLFGDASDVNDYLELCRFFVYDWCPKNTASQFLSITHRIIRKYAPAIKWLYTYAAGFQGMVGGIYKAANYDYIGRTLCNSFIYVPGRGLVHNIALWHRYGTISGSNDASLRRFQDMVPDARRWCGYNFRYIYWLCEPQEKARLMQSARFAIEPYPTEDDMEIWLEDVGGRRQPITPEFAKTVPIVRLSSKRPCAGSIDSDASAFHAEQGGATPTPALHDMAAD